MNVLDSQGFTASPVVLVEQVQLCSFQIGHLSPNAFVSAAKAMKKARQLVWANCRFYRPRFKRFFCRQISLVRSALLSVKGKPPGSCVIDRRVSHMSGLRGLFVWKQKATTDAPGTHIISCIAGLALGAPMKNNEVSTVASVFLDAPNLTRWRLP